MSEPGAGQMSGSTFVLETVFGSRCFRSRTEARWAVFFDAMGWSYEYERDGFQFGKCRYLPDFWLPGLKVWWEVKGALPTAREKQLARRLQNKTGQPCIISVGQPKPRAEQLVCFDNSGDHLEERFCTLLADRRNNGEYWLYGECWGKSLGPVFGPDHGKYPADIDEQLERAFAKALSARFGT